MTDLKEKLTVSEVSQLAGVSVRTLHHYDRIGLLHPAEVTVAGYRLYGEAELERLQQILFFRELQFPLQEIKKILDSDRFDRNKALDQQIELLEMKKEHLENLILYARGIRMTGVKNMDFSAFDTRKMDEYVQEAKEQWGKSEVYKEFEEKTKDWTEDTARGITEEFISIFSEFGRIMSNGAAATGADPAGEEAQAQVQKLRDYITRHFYNCTPQILTILGQMYTGDGRFAETIDEAGGVGTADFAGKAIEVYCSCCDKNCK